MTEKLYTEQEVKLLLVENNKSALFKSIDRIDNHLTAIDGKIDNFKYWVLTSLFAISGMIIADNYVK